MSHYKLIFVGFISLFCQTVALSDTVRVTTDDVGFQRWQWQDSDVFFSLTQRSPDQTRAFFLARGFTKAQADLIGESCVFQTIFRNEGQSPLTFDLEQWTVHYQGQRLKPRTREFWQQQWEKMAVSKSARIAFNWSLLPTKQTFQSGDYNWGMSSYGLKPGETFDLSFFMMRNGEKQRYKISGIVCAPE